MVLAASLNEGIGVALGSTQRTSTVATALPFSSFDVTEFPATVGCEDKKSLVIQVVGPVL
jgi:hypothetical protein